LRAKSFHPSIVAGIHQASARFQKLLPDVKTFTNDKVSSYGNVVCVDPNPLEKKTGRRTRLYFCKTTDNNASIETIENSNSKICFGFL